MLKEKIHFRGILNFSGRIRPFFNVWSGYVSDHNTRIRIHNRNFSFWERKKDDIKKNKQIDKGRETDRQTVMEGETSILYLYSMM